MWLIFHKFPWYDDVTMISNIHEIRELYQYPPKNALSALYSMNLVLAPMPLPPFHCHQPWPGLFEIIPVTGAYHFFNHWAWFAAFCLPHSNPESCDSRVFVTVQEGWRSHAFHFHAIPEIKLEGWWTWTPLAHDESRSPVLGLVCGTLWIHKMIFTK